MTKELVEVVQAEVTQADRDAAADIVRCGAPGLGNGNAIIAAEIKGGLHDGYTVVQLVASARLSAEAAIVAWLRETEWFEDRGWPKQIAREIERGAHRHGS